MAGLAAGFAAGLALLADAFFAGVETAFFTALATLPTAFATFPTALLFLAGALATFFAGFLAATRFLWVVEPLRRRVIAFRPQRGNPPSRGSPILKRLVLASLRGYKRFISPLLGQHCRFHPTCSLYMYEAVQKHGTA